MLKRALGFLFLLAIGAILAFNFKRILVFGQAHEIRQAAQPAVTAKNWEKAIQAYEKGWKQYPDNPSIMVRLAWLYQQAGQPERAEETYRGVLKRDPDHVEAAIGLANLIKAKPSRVNEAVVILRKALKANPTDARLLSQIGNLYKTAAENPAEKRESTRKWLYDQARYYYQASLKQNPRQFQTQFNLGVVYQSAEKLQNSAQAYCKAAIMLPDSYESRYNLGMVLSELDYLEEAYRQMDRSVKILVEKGDIETAQSMAIRVQHVKNRIFNSGRQGLSSRTDPPFLDQACLVKPMPNAETADHRSKKAE
jgi:tetratricopeptide (TPR) repeat protein